MCWLLKNPLLANLWLVILLVLPLVGFTQTNSMYYYGDSGEDRGIEVIPVRNGGFMVVANSNISGFWLPFLIRLDNQGDTLWTKKLPALNSYYVNRIYETKGSNLLLITGNILHKLDSAGVYLWSKQLPVGSYPRKYTGVVETDINTLLLSFNDFIGSGGYYCKSRVIQVDTLGNSISGSVYYGYDGTINDLKRFSSSKYLICGGQFYGGVFEQKIVMLTQALNPIWTYQMYGTELNTIFVNEDKKIISTGNEFSNPPQTRVLILDSLKVVQANKLFAAPRISCVVEADSGNFWCSGSLKTPNGDFDGTITQLSSSADTSGMKSFGGSEDDYLTSIVNTLDSGIISVGTTSSFGLGVSDVLIVRADKNGFLTKRLEVFLNSSSSIVYPQPALTSHGAKIWFGSETGIISIYDVNGALIKQETIVPDQVLSFSNSGMYFYSLVENQKTSIGKIIVVE